VQSPRIKLGTSRTEVRALTNCLVNHLEIVGLARESPGMSCKHILDNGDAVHGDGKYWIDPDNSNNPLLVYCDMAHDQGMLNSFTTTKMC